MHTLWSPLVTGTATGPRGLTLDVPRRGEQSAAPRAARVLDVPRKGEQSAARYERIETASSFCKVLPFGTSNPQLERFCLRLVGARSEENRRPIAAESLGFPSLQNEGEV